MDTLTVRRRTILQAALAALATTGLSQRKPRDRYVDRYEDVY